MAPTSFSAPVGGSNEPGADTVGETIADDTEASPEDVAVRLNLHQDMDNVLATLSERESGILRCRYGLDDGRQRTLEEVGQIFKASRFSPSPARSFRAPLELLMARYSCDEFPISGGGERPASSAMGLQTGRSCPLKPLYGRTPINKRVDGKF